LLQCRASGGLAPESAPVADGGTGGPGDGGPALQAEFTGAAAVAVASSGHVHFADAYRIRVLEP